MTAARNCLRLWVDTDVGDNPDDAVALLCACAHPAVDLVGVSTTGGDTEWRAELAAELVDTTVVAGAHRDLVVDAVSDTRPDALLAIGPLTNVAALCVLGRLPPRLALMGGALTPVQHRGTERAVEHNFGSDPSAAAVVVDSTDALVVPLDVTVAMRLSPRSLDDVVSAAPVLAPEVERWIAAQHAATPESDAAVVLHDPLALLALIGERCVAIESRALAVAPDGSVHTDTGRIHPVAVGVDPRVAIRRVLALLAARGDGAGSRPAPSVG